MKVLKKRWGEVTIRKQGEGKNNFDESKSFSVAQTSTNYSIDEYCEILNFLTNLTERYKFNELKSKLVNL